MKFKFSANITIKPTYEVSTQADAINAITLSPNDALISIQINSSYNSAASYASLLSASYKLEKVQKQLDGSSLVIMQREDGQIWMTGSRKIIIYDQDFEQIRVQYTGNNMADILSMCSTDLGYIIVACKYNQGLHELDENGHYMRKMLKGGLGQVVAYSSLLYVLDYMNDYIIILNFKNHSWKEIKRFKTGLEEHAKDDTMSLNNKHIFVASALFYEMNIFDHYGNLVNKSKTSLEYQYLRGVDNFGYTLFVEYDEHKVTVCNSQIFCQSIQLLDDTKQKPLQYPFDVLVGKDNAIIWVSTGTWLRKYRRNI